MSLTVQPVTTKADLRRFVKLPWRIYRNEPRWVPPLISERMEFLDRSRNPFFEHAEAQYWLAERDGEAVGRITAQVDRNYNEFHHNADGMFGFFECEEDPEAARALLATAEAWLIERGRDRMLGPMDFTTNDECGLLVDGFEERPFILCPWQHPYYAGLIEAAGLEKVMDLWLWDARLANRGDVAELIWKVADKVTSEHRVTIRQMRKRDFEAELGRFLEVYNAAWERNWGFVPLTEAEVRHQAKALKPILDENWAMIAERDGEVLGAALTLPDFNQVFARLNGRLLPFGWAKFLLAKRKIDEVRVFALGVKPEYRHLGIAAAFYKEHYDAAQRTGVTGGKMGWILENNRPMNRAMQGMGGTVTSTYRIFGKALAEGVDIHADTNLRKDAGEE